MCVNGSSATFFLHELLYFLSFLLLIDTPFILIVALLVYYRYPVLYLITNKSIESFHNVNSVTNGKKYISSLCCKSHYPRVLLRKVAFRCSPGKYLKFYSGSQGLTNKFSSRPSVERLIMSYSEDLILVLKSLFDFTQKPDLAGSANWEVLKEAFEAYMPMVHAMRKKKTHNFCRLA